MARVSGPRLRLTIEGDGAAEDELRAIGARARDAKPVMRVIQGLMVRGAKEQFESEGARGGLAWDPDTQAWVKRKAAKGEDTRIERRTGALWESLTMESGDFAEEIRKVLKASTTFGTRIFHAQFQGHRRQLLRITLKDADLWAELIVDWILSGNLPGGEK
jgi:hypothetical protein